MGTAVAILIGLALMLIGLVAYLICMVIVMHRTGEPLTPICWKYDDLEEVFFEDEAHGIY